MPDHPELHLQRVVAEPLIDTAVLVYGRDAHLIDTRRWVLEHAGIRATTATEWQDAQRILTAEPIDLFILCHTLSPEESDHAIATAHALRPAMKLLVLTANTPLGSLGRHEKVISAFSGPRTLVAAVETLLALDTPTLQSV